MLYKTEEIFLSVIIGVILILFLVVVFLVSVVKYKKRISKNLEEKLKMENLFKEEILQTKLETQEDTFQQIGEELHDNIGQLLSSTKMLLGITERSLNEIPDTLNTAQEMLGKAINDLRSLSKSLNKDWLRQFNLIQILQAEVDRFNSVGSLELKLVSGVSFVPLPSEAQVMLFRVIQEAFQNCIKHSEASRIDVVIAFENDLNVLIEDNGKGFNRDLVNSGGIGLLSMEHRTKLLGGTINWESAPGGGTRIIIKIPVQTKDI
jgi:signal transduction histidine kinase